MLRVIQNSRAAGAKSYYSTADYYTEGQELIGLWQGTAAERLGLSGEVTKEAWDALCDNRDPNTGKLLTARQRQDRRVGYDFNFHVPKSVSVLYGITGDERILEAFRDSVRSTMHDIESELQTRVRKGGKNADRTTGNAVWGEFIHTTARPVDGVPDPHLHAHCFVFNVTWDFVESRWKAGQFAGVKRDAPYFEAVFHSRLARNLQALGLDVERTRKGWELAGIPKTVIPTFSRRTTEIEALAEKEGIVDPVAKGELGAKTRNRKRKQLSMGELREEWGRWMSAKEQNAVRTVTERIGSEPIPADARVMREAVTLAIDHCLERRSVVPERKLLTEAMHRAYGAASPEAVQTEQSSRQLLGATRDGIRLVTTPDVLSEEQHLVAFAREGRGRERGLAANHTIRREWLNEGQRRAVKHVLSSRDRVILLRGAAGVGKTSMMQEAVEAIEAVGTRVFPFAPSADASRGVLRDQEGFKDADTVARLLVDETLQERVRGQVMWIDEAGLLGTRTTGRLFELADRLNARVVLSGDRKQHGSVERGAALRLLEEEAGLVPAEIKDIQRQSGAYKRAIGLLAEGDTAAGFRELDKLGWVREVDDESRYGMLASDFVSVIKAGKSALVVSPTHKEGDHITREIREGLKRESVLGSDEHELTTLTNLNLTEAERREAVNFQPGDVLVFHQNAKGFRRGQRVVVGKAKVPLDQAARFQVFRAGKLAIAPGDVLRVTRNGTTSDGKHRLNNGQLVRVKSIDAGGDMTLSNGWKVAKDFGHLAHGYVVTSHASQGKTVDQVFIGQSSESVGAASREQFYVSASRGRERAIIYTDDKRALLDAIARPEDRMTATELTGRSKERSRRDGRGRTTQTTRELNEARNLDAEPEHVR